MRSLLTTLAVLVLAATGQVVAETGAALPAGGTDEGYLGIYADVAGTQSCGSIPVGTVGTVYLYANLAGASSGGIVGTEFRIEVSNPSGYQFVYEPPPASNVQLGTALDTDPTNFEDFGGITVAFPNCQTGRPSLGRVRILNLGGGPTELRIVRATPPNNPRFLCPTFIRCDAPIYTQVCQASCSVDGVGRAVTGRVSLNDPNCAGGFDCPAPCAGGPCVSIVGSGPQHACPGASVTVTATATNCSPVPADIDVFVQFGLAGQFTGVLPGQSVVASRTYVHPACTAGDYVAAVARTSTCPAPRAAEKILEIGCGGLPCNNRAPNCDGGYPSVAALWPADGRMVPVTVQGIVDPDGDPVSVEILWVYSDERVGSTSTTCPDAILDGPTIQLRAERDASGDGRIYHAAYRAYDPTGQSCTDDIKVCVPRKVGECNTNGFIRYNSRVCDVTGGGGGGAAPLHVRRSGGSLEASFASSVEAPARLEVYDVRGRLVRTLVDARLAPGEHLVRWDGRDSSGHLAATGVYLFTLRIGEEIQKSKAVLAR